MNDECNGPDCYGKVRGDEGKLPDRGTRTGVEDTYGADLSEDATNRVRGMTKDTQSDSEAA